MALSNYLTLVNALLQNPSSNNNLYDQTLITLYINQSRTWLAGDSQAIKSTGTFSLSIGSRGPYPFSAIVLTAPTGTAGVLNVRQLWYGSGSGMLWVPNRTWEWYSIYNLNIAAPVEGPPFDWAQYGDGEKGTLYIGPPPDQAYTMTADCVCYPIPLVDDSTVEAIPAPWTIAVPYYAAYLALLSAQTGARVQDAQRMLELYEKFAAGARRQSTSEVLPLQFDQTVNAVRATQYDQGQPQQGGR